MLDFAIQGASFVVGGLLAAVACSGGRAVWVRVLAGGVGVALPLLLVGYCLFVSLFGGKSGGVLAVVGLGMISGWVLGAGIQGAGWLYGYIKRANR